jgi:hypothetical protein
LPYLETATAANYGESVSSIMNQQNRLDRDETLAAAMVIGQDRNYNREPDYWLYVFNISTRTFVRHRPPDFPNITLRACPAGQPYVLAARVRDTINYKVKDVGTGQTSLMSISGERWATDLINPANLGNQMWTEVSNPEMDLLHGGGDDLSRRGVFWSRNEVPTPEELARSRTLMERHYRLLVEQAEELAGDPKTRREIGAEHHLAAEYLHMNSSWHVRTAVQEACPNCGEPVNPGIAYHPSAVGGVCVLDWKRAVSAGVKTKAEVPEDQRWWKEEPEPPAPEPLASGPLRPPVGKLR